MDTFGGKTSLSNNEVLLTSDLYKKYEEIKKIENNKRPLSAKFIHP